MAAPLETLKRLHDVDQELLALEAAMAASRRAIAAAEAEEQAAGKALEAARGKSQGTRAKEGLKEVELKDLEGQILSWTVKLNTTRDNKEYQGIQHQIATLKERKGGLEEEILGLMDVETVEKGETRGETEHLAEARRALDGTRSREEAAIQARRARAEGLAGRRLPLAEAVPAEILSYYERIRTGRGGVALAPVADGVCLGCHMGVTPNQVNQLAVGRDLVKCLSCGRFLYPVPEAGTASDG
jgi:predicted  nucleic acid-binding Zn-ribbon protein